MPRFAVVGCKRCQQAWTVEERHESSRCPRCGTTVQLRKRTRLWQGEDASQAQREAGRINTGLAQGDDTLQASVTRHDSPLDAVAAKARTLRNASRRAEAVALWATRIIGDTTKEDLLEAMTRAGIDGARAEKEIIRMLACDLIMEPRPAVYRCLEV